MAFRTREILERITHTRKSTYKHQENRCQCNYNRDVKLGSLTPSPNPKQSRAQCSQPLQHHPGTSTPVRRSPGLAAQGQAGAAVSHLLPG